MTIITADSQKLVPEKSCQKVAFVGMGSLAVAASGPFLETTVTHMFLPA